MLSAKKAINGPAPAVSTGPSSRLPTAVRPTSSGSSYRTGSGHVPARGTPPSSRPPATSTLEDTTDAKTAKPVIAYDDVVHRVQEWNKALKGESYRL